MNMDADLKKLVRRTYLVFFQDGLWDICLGVFLLGWGLSILTDLTYLAGSLFISLYFVIWGLKKWLTYPRVGYVKLGASQERFRVMISIVLGITALAGIFFAIIFVADDRPRWIMDCFPLLFSGMLAIIVGGIAWWMGVYRFIFHAGLIFVAGLVQQWTEIEWAYTYIGAGAVITLTGVAYLVHFLRKYTRMPAEEPDDRP